MRRKSVLITVALLAVLTGCSTPDPGGPGPTPTSPGPTTSGSPGPTGSDELLVTVDDGSGATRSWRLTCDPPGGTHPDPATACRALEENGAALRPVSKDRRCTDRYGGPQTATITGTWQGQPVNSRLSLVNGCEISRWRALAGLLPAAGG